MKNLLKLGAILVFGILVLGPFTTHAFNSGTHLYIAEQVLQKCTQKIDLYYGSIAPDLSLYVAKPTSWRTSFEDTHYKYIDLRSYALGKNQKAFALGWLTHNEEWGADFYSHIKCPSGNGEGYVIQKAEALVNCLLYYSLDLDPEFAHYVIEVAIDLLIKNNDDHKLGEKLLLANLFRSWEDRNLLVKVLVLKEKKTDWLTLATAELTFRNLVNQYAMALVLHSPYDKKALAELGVQLALEMYGIKVTKEEVLYILEAAISLCEGDYKEVIEYTIGQIRGKL
jgi:hypothetical protein